MGAGNSDELVSVSAMWRGELWNLFRTNHLPHPHPMTQEPTPSALSRRDEFAKAAMQGLLAGKGEIFYSGMLGVEVNDRINSVVLRSIDCADAMIAELDRTTPKSDA